MTDARLEQARQTKIPLWKCSRRCGRPLRGLEVRAGQLGMSQRERHGCSQAGDRGMTGQRGDRVQPWKPLGRGKDGMYST